MFKNSKALIGMIHLSGNQNTRIERALEELIILEEENFNGAIIENYHASPFDVEKTLIHLKILN